MSSSSAKTNPNYANPMLNGVDDEAKLATLPIGFRFKPTDATLISDYLARKNLGEQLDPNRMKEVLDFYDHHPEELTQKYKGYESNNWYFFTRKYPGDEAAGGRANNANRVRVAGNGYWLPLLHSSPIYSRGDSSNLVGWKDTLVYHEVRGDKVYETEYVMKEYKTAGAIQSGCKDTEVVKKDEWILCGVFMNEKSGGGGSFERSASTGSDF